MSLPKPSGLPRLSEVKLTRRTLVAGGAALAVAGAGVAVGWLGLFVVKNWVCT